MIGISTTTFDLDGTRIFHRVEKSTLSGVARRVSRTATLNVDASFFDGGFTHADRTLDVVQTRPEQADVDFCQYIVQNYGEVVVSTHEGAFLCVPESANVDSRGDLKIRFLVKEKLDE